VTGAPKIRAMDVITELEDSARGPYCGAVGFIAPNGDACFNVAIRTAVLDNGALRYNVGSGVVYDSDGPDEYRECLLKSRIFTPQSESLIETLLWTPEAGYQYEAAHKTRLLEGARKNDIPLSAGQLDEDVKPQDWTAPQRVRWELDKVGKIKITSASYTPITEPLKIAVSQYPLTKAVQRHDVKTSRRDFYDGERARIKALLPEVDEVIFVNAAGQLCEGSFTSLFLDIDGARLTPALSAGLLPGVLRGELITSGDVSEATLTPADLSKADAVWLGNSLRGLMRAELVQNKPI
jgi:para-aminobenzoate synthetase/4-amino-4-deoxychorismate lyase